MPATIKMEDLALVVSNPQSSQGSSGEGEGVLVDTAAVETITIGALSQDDAAEAIQGLQALAQRGVLESGTVVEEQVQVSAGRPGELKEQVQVSVGRPSELKEQVQVSMGRPSELKEQVQVRLGRPSELKEQVQALSLIHI